MVCVVIVAMTLWDFEPEISYAEGRERGLIRWNVGYEVVYPAAGQANVSDISDCVAFDLHRGRDRVAGFGEARGCLGFCGGTVQGSRQSRVRIRHLMYGHHLLIINGFKELLHIDAVAKAARQNLKLRHASLKLTG